MELSEITVLKRMANRAKDYYYNAEKLHELYPNNSGFDNRYNEALSVFCEYCMMSDKLGIDLFD
jgi:hypothetical protein